MIFDHRTYTCKPGTVRKALELYEQHGMAAQIKHLGPPVLYGMTEVGNVNTYIHVWAYQDLADRTRRRAAMQADPAWQAYLQKSSEAGYLLSQVNTILTAAPFFKVPGR